jgi:sRNA-binding carbon storage regulator CsrA
MSRLTIHCELGRSFWIGEARVTLLEGNRHAKPNELKVVIEAPRSVVVSRDGVKHADVTREDRTP